MPKAPAFSEDEDEKTTIESGWEEEASTTVEQGDVAEKIRVLEAARQRNHITNITSTNGNSVLDEPTVDDQRASAALELLSPSTVVARLMVTAGNDSGQHIEVLPGKSYTIGRAIDNDFVLTDIAVSRKHFDLRHEIGTWVLADRGSGNGTLVNGNIEDQPFVLANGDTIEIGNTTFRFENPNGAPRRAAAGTFEISPDDEEPSTVAGKPVLRSEEIATPAHVPPAKRPKTVPPPAPLPRPRTASSAPPVSYPVGIGSTSLGAHGVGSMSMPNLGSQSISASKPMAAPQMLQPQMQPVMPMPQMVPVMQPATTLPMPQMASRPLGPQAPTILNAGALPTTIPGQGPPLNGGYPYQGAAHPSSPDMLNGLNGHRNGHAIVANQPGRDATSTALVQPTPYSAMMAPPPAVFAAPRPALSRRAKLLLAGTGLAMLAAIATVAIIKASSDDAPVAAKSAPPPKKAEPAVVKKEPPKLDPFAPSSKVTPTANRKPDPKLARVEPGPKSPSPIVEPIVEPPKPGPKLDAPKVEPAKVEPAKVEPPKVEPPKVEPPKVEPPKVEPPKVEPPVDPKPGRLVKQPDPKPTRTTTPNKRTTKITRADPPPSPPRADPPPKRVATVDAGDVKGRANDLYRGKKFNDAASLLRSAASITSSKDDATDLRTLAAIYEQVGRAYNRGMSPGAKPVEAFTELRRALNLDNALGVFKDEIQGKLVQVAPRAAIQFFLAKEYEAAYGAVREAERYGSTSSDLKGVRDNLTSIALQLYNEASKEIGSSPDTAKAKLRQVKSIVDPKSTTWIKANKLLQSS